MFCKECGKEIDNDSKFCSFCGTKQSNILSNEKIKEKVKEPEPASRTVNVNLAFSSAKSKIEKPVVEQIKIEKYDLTYEREYGATVAGVILSILLLVFYFTEGFGIHHLQTYIFLSIFVNLVLRIAIIIWVINISKRQNRNSTGWGLFALFTPSLAIIIIGLLKKLNKQLLIQLHSEIPQNLTDNHINDILEEELRQLDDVTYEEVQRIKTNNFWGIETVETKLKFSDNTSGSVYCFYNRKEHFIRHKSLKHIYADKETAIKGLHILLTTNDIFKGEGYLHFDL